VGLERGPFSLVSTIEELLGRYSSCSGLEIREYGRGDPLRWPRDTLYPQKLALTSSTSGGGSVFIVRLRTKATELFFPWSHWVKRVVLGDVTCFVFEPCDKQNCMVHVSQFDQFLACFPYFDEIKIGLWYHLAVRVLVYLSCQLLNAWTNPISLCVCMCISLSLLGNASVKTIPYQRLHTQ
jgi:hypothetical protein